MELGVHDLIRINHRETPEEAMKRTMSFVQEIERLNYHRYWFAEHHNAPTLASVSPELLVSYAAALTDRIRLGTGGTMIMHYSPLKIAENFKTLTALAPDRIDIGLGRAPGSGPEEILALAEGRPHVYSDMYDKIGVILDYLSDQEAPDFYGKVKAMPSPLSTYTQPWMLGSSGQSAQAAASMGLGYAFAKFFGINTNPEVFQMYRDQFKPSVFFDQPRVSVSYLIVVADSDEEADFIAKPIELGQLAILNGRKLPNYSPEEVRDYHLDADQAAWLQRFIERHFIIKGSKETVARILDEEIQAIKMDEILVYAPIFDDTQRLRSYKYLAELFNKI